MQKFKQLLTESEDYASYASHLDDEGVNAATLEKGFVFCGMSPREAQVYTIRIFQYLNQTGVPRVPDPISEHKGFMYSDIVSAAYQIIPSLELWDEDTLRQYIASSYSEK